MTFQTYQWSELDEQMQAFVIALHAESWHIEHHKTADLYQVFHVGNPALIFDSLQKYCRIGTESVEKMRSLFREYLLQQV